MNCFLFLKKLIEFLSKNNGKEKWNSPVYVPWMVRLNILWSRNQSSTLIDECEGEQMRDPSPSDYAHPVQRFSRGCRRGDISCLWIFNRQVSTFKLADAWQLGSRWHTYMEVDGTIYPSSNFTSLKAQTP